MNTVISGKVNQKFRASVLRTGIVFLTVSVLLFVLSFLLLDVIDEDIRFLPWIAASVVFVLGVELLVYLLLFRNCTLTVANDGIYGIAAFSGAVFLPLAQIKQITFCDWFVRITVENRSYWFGAFENASTLHNTIRILQRQSGSRSGQPKSCPPAMPQSGPAPEKEKPERNHVGNSRAVARDLKRYKKLCDQGILSREEFEAKKRQLLEL